MKVKDFIKELEKLNPELDLYLQIDQEGNGYEEWYEEEGKINGAVVYP